MKSLPTIACLCLSTISFGQTIENEKVILTAAADYKPATIELTKDKNKISSFQTHGNKTTFKGLETGYYGFIISGPGQPQIQTDSILVTEGQKLELIIILGGICLYDHPSDWIPNCPENHTDNIIPIAFGLVGELENSKTDDVHLGGCIVTDCDPKYYCKKHKLEF